MNKKIALVSFLLIFLVSCASPAAPQPTATPIPSPTQTASATPTANPEPTSTVTPTPTIAVPENVADYTPENTPLTFEHMGITWTRLQDALGKDVWRPVNADGTLVAGMEYVTMEHVEMLLGNVNSMMVVYNLGSPESGEFNIAVSPLYKFWFDFSKSGKSMKQIGDELRDAIVAKATDPEAKELMENGAPITVLIGQKEKVWNTPCSSSSALHPSNIKSADGTVTRKYLCVDGDGFRFFGPLEELGGNVTFGITGTANIISQTNISREDSLEHVGAGFDSPIRVLGNALKNGTLGKDWIKVHGINPAIKLIEHFTNMLNGLVSVRWVD